MLTDIFTTQGKGAAKDEMTAKTKGESTPAIATWSESKTVTANAHAKTVVTCTGQTHIVKVSTGSDSPGQVLISVTKVRLTLQFLSQKL